MDFEGEGAAAALGHRHGREQESHLYALRIWQCQAANVRSGNRQFPRITRTSVLSYRYCPLRGLVARYGGRAFRVPKTGGLVLGRFYVVADSQDATGSVGVHTLSDRV